MDARVDGGLLLELYSRDGVGTMISTDFYEGIRHAGPLDVPGIKACPPTELFDLFFFHRAGFSATCACTCGSCRQHSKHTAALPCALSVYLSQQPLHRSAGAPGNARSRDRARVTHHRVCAARPPRRRCRARVCDSLNSRGIAMQELLATLEARGIVVPRAEAELAADVAEFVVIEREARIIACAQLKPLGAAAAFASVAEVASFAVHRDFRGVGRGDSLLDWVEQEARYRGHDCLVLLTTRTADWFQVRSTGCAVLGAADDAHGRLVPGALFWLCSAWCC